jgi:hypothetical protein
MYNCPLPLYKGYPSQMAYNMMCKQAIKNIPLDHKTENVYKGLELMTEIASHYLNKH